MIKDFDHEITHYANRKIKELGEELARLQRRMIDEEIPVLIIMEGWESAGHDLIIREFIRELNPRNYRVRQYHYYDRVDTDRPIMRKYWDLLPKRGDMTLLDRSYYFKMMNDPDPRIKIKKAYEMVETFERLLIDDGMVILKFFLHVEKKTHRERIKELKEDKFRHFFIEDVDERQYKNYEKYGKKMNKILTKTNFDFSSWHIISAEDQKDAAREILGLTIEKIREKSEQNKQPNSERVPFTGPFPLSDLNLSLQVDDDFYDEQLDEYQAIIEKLTYQLYIKNVPVILTFEGVDAAGKGGAIERLTRTMDPRFYDVKTISAPTEEELSYHYLWRFYREFPVRGKMKIFDRSWYGRVLVERIEGFSKEWEWNRAYDEINTMEHHLFDEGAFILKFFIMIDKDEQLKRFKARKIDKDKVYKLTDEDWRNREKWDEYIDAMNEMLVRTNTTVAPWIIVEGNDKKFARLKVLREFIERAHEFLQEIKD